MSEQNWEGGGGIRNKEGSPFGKQILGSDPIHLWILHFWYRVDVQRLGTEWKIPLISVQRWRQKSLARMSNTYFELIHIGQRKDRLFVTREDFNELNFVNKCIFLTLLPFHHLLHHFWLVWCLLRFFVLIENTVVWVIILDNNKIKLA